jgi:hypothetical protein
MSSLLNNLNQISAQAQKENTINIKPTTTPKFKSPNMLQNIKEETKTSVNTEILTENSKSIIELKLIKKLKSSKDVKKTVDCSYDLDDRLKLFLSDYNKEFRHEAEFSILTFQLLCQTALEEYLDNRGY